MLGPDAKPMYRCPVSGLSAQRFYARRSAVAGAQVISRIGSFVPLPDFDTLPNRKDQTDACRIAMWTAKYLILNWGKLRRYRYVYGYGRKKRKNEQQNIAIAHDKDSL